MRSLAGREDSLPVISEGLFGAARFEKVRSLAAMN